jgi:hypothetical protein
MPMSGGSLEALTSFFNLPSRSDFILVVAWLLAALRHGGPYPLLAVSGEQGSANTNRRLGDSRGIPESAEA